MNNDPSPHDLPPISNDAPSLGNDMGFQYYKLSIERADAAWEKIHTITRWNFAALAAAIVLMSTDYAKLGDPTARLSMICSFVVVASLVASALAYMHFNYAFWLYGQAWIAEKQWLGNRNSVRTIEKLREHRSVSALRKGDAIPLRFASLAEMLTNIHVITNLIPGVLAIVAFLLLEPL